MLSKSWPILAILLTPFGIIAPTHFWIIRLSNLSILSLPDEGYSRNASCVLTLISTFVLPSIRSIWAIKLQWLNTFFIYTVIDRNIAFLVTLSCYVFSFGKLVIKQFTSDWQKKKVQPVDNYIILLFNSKYKRRWINVMFLRFSVYSIQKWGKVRWTSAFIPVFKASYT